MRRVSGGEEIATPIEAHDIAALAGQLLEKVDAPVHHRDHVVAGAGPPVAVALCGLVAREGEGRALVHEEHVAHSAADGQVVGGGDAGNTCATDHDLRCDLGHDARQHTSTRPPRVARAFTLLYLHDISPSRSHHMVRHEQG